MSKFKYAVSACLAGCECRFDGKAKTRPEFKALVESGQAVAICPEELGELPTPRPPAEIKNDRVYSKLGKDVTVHYQLGALRALQITDSHHITEFYLKSKSPMCGFNRIYDGEFSGNLIQGHGVFTKLLLEKNFKVTEVE